jgi:hypothetical protein
MSVLLLLPEFSNEISLMSIIFLKIIAEISRNNQYLIGLVDANIDKYICIFNNLADIVLQFPGELICLTK